MYRKYWLTIVAIGSLAAPCFGELIDTYPDWDGSTTNFWHKIAQSFTVGSDNVLNNYMFALEPPGGQDTITFEIFEWDNSSGPVGDALYSVQEAWPEGGGDVLVDNIGLQLATGDLFAAIVDLRGYTGRSVHWQENQDSYSNGDASWFGKGRWRWLDSGWNTKFRAELVPEPGTLAMLGVGLAGVLIRRHRRN